LLNSPARWRAANFRDTGRPRSAANDTKRAENEQLFGVDDVGREYSNRQAATSSHSRRLNASISSFVLTAVAN
jgi:hypothetical protein